jgi:putative hydrolase of the HAD superfamily
MIKQYSHIYFDLDHTLWDFDRNSEEALCELYDTHSMGDWGIESALVFIEKYRTINRHMWDLYHKKLIDKVTLRENRFINTLHELGVDEKWHPKNLWDQYLSIAPSKTHLFPNTLEVLEYLQQKGYDLSIITNGFKEVQHLKISNSGLEKFFANVFISEDIGWQKPEAEIFRHAMQATGGIPESSIMIGDTLDTDILGAQNAGIDQVFFNPAKLPHEAEPTYEIHSLPQLKELL